MKHSWPRPDKRQTMTAVIRQSGQWYFALKAKVGRFEPLEGTLLMEGYHGSWGVVPVKSKVVRTCSWRVLL